MEKTSRCLRRLCRQHRSRRKKNRSRRTALGDNPGRLTRSAPLAAARTFLRRTRCSHRLAQARSKTQPDSLGKSMWTCCHGPWSRSHSGGTAPRPRVGTFPGRLLCTDRRRKSNRAQRELVVPRTPPRTACTRWMNLNLNLIVQPGMSGMALPYATLPPSTDPRRTVNMVSQGCNRGRRSQPGTLVSRR